MFDKIVYLFSLIIFIQTAVFAQDAKIDRPLYGPPSLYVLALKKVVSTMRSKNMGSLFRDAVLEEYQAREEEREGNITLASGNPQKPLELLELCRLDFDTQVDVQNLFAASGIDWNLWKRYICIPPSSCCQSRGIYERFGEGFGDPVLDEVRTVFDENRIKRSKRLKMIISDHVITQAMLLMITPQQRESVIHMLQVLDLGEYEETRNILDRFLLQRAKK